VKSSILKIGEILLTSVQDGLTDHDALEFQYALLEKVENTEAMGVVIDISEMDIVDSFLARVINDTANMVQLLGAKVVLCGMQPSVALTLVEMGRELIGVETALDLSQGLQKVKEFTTDEFEQGDE